MTAVADYGRRSGSCWASNRTLAVGLGLHEKTVAAALRLVEGELVLAEHHSPTGTLSRRVKPVSEDELAVTISAAARNRLSGYRFKVYCAISVRSDLGQSASAAQLAQACGMTPEGARTTARDLVTEGWVTRDGSSGGAPKYVVHPVPLAGVAVQLGLFPQPQQSARPEAVPALDEVTEGWFCTGQMALFGEDAEWETPLDSAPATPLDRLPEAPLGSAPLTGHLQQAGVNRQLTVDGCLSRVAVTLVTRDAGAREGASGRAQSVVAAGGRSPLRGEQPKIAAVSRVTPSGTGGARTGRWLDAPVGSVFGLPQGLRVALAPAVGLWRRLERSGTREFIASQVMAELRRVSVWTGPAAAPAALALRLTRRLDRQGGPSRVTDPVGWFLSRGLPQGQVCARTSCDDGIRLDTGSLCDTCEMRLVDRRATRKVLVSEVLTLLPGAGYEERQAVIEEHLRDHARAHAERQVAARERAEAQRQRVEADRPAREAAAAAAEEARVAVPCADCGTERSAGLCGICWCHREARSAIAAAVSAMLTTVNLCDRDAVSALVREVRDGMRSAMLSARPARELAPDAHAIANSDMLAAKNRSADYRNHALVLLAGSPKAEQEAEQAADVRRRWAHRYASAADARQAVADAANEARWRTAMHLFTERLRQVKELRDRTRSATQQPAANRASRFTAALGTCAAAGRTA
ncbi:hypothetical protein LN042_24190 [Kitasatospora sp. RB6PN24]|uniref:hypothetical protein n=1 Tax=Kitasatospora humi TaxID=2893891 RepID=UPI001E2DDA36|nr:hypothetical protein [Kitasatospora humi]MCC9310130.1 hypothetical protein [Kitasatospora humi]